MSFKVVVGFGRKNVVPTDFSLVPLHQVESTEFCKMTLGVIDSYGCGSKTCYTKMAPW